LTLKLKRVGEAKMRNPFVLSRFAETVSSRGRHKQLGAGTGYGDGMNLEEVARDRKNAREVLGAVKARTLVGVAAMLSEVAENLSRTAESRFVGVSCRRR
jgi:hypothetical protein